MAEASDSRRQGEGDEPPDIVTRRFQIRPGTLCISCVLCSFFVAQSETERRYVREERRTAASGFETLRCVEAGIRSESDTFWELEGKGGSKLKFKF